MAEYFYLQLVAFLYLQPLARAQQITLTGIEPGRMLAGAGMIVVFAPGR